jgi:hypothetical protein
MAGAKAPNAMAGRPTLIGVFEPLARTLHTRYNFVGISL